MANGSNTVAPPAPDWNQPITVSPIVPQSSGAPAAPSSTPSPTPASTPSPTPQQPSQQQPQFPPNAPQYASLQQAGQYQGGGTPWGRSTIGQLPPYLQPSEAAPVTGITPYQPEQPQDRQTQLNGLSTDQITGLHDQGTIGTNEAVTAYKVAREREGEGDPDNGQVAADILHSFVDVVHGFGAGISIHNIKKGIAQQVGQMGDLWNNFSQAYGGGVKDVDNLTARAQQLLQSNNPDDVNEGLRRMSLIAQLNDVNTQLASLGTMTGLAAAGPDKLVSLQGQRANLVSQIDPVYAKDNAQQAMHNLLSGNQLTGDLLRSWGDNTFGDAAADRYSNWFRKNTPLKIPYELDTDDKIADALNAHKADYDAAQQSRAGILTPEGEQSLARMSALGGQVPKTTEELSAEEMGPQQAEIEKIPGQWSAVGQAGGQLLTAFAPLPELDNLLVPWLGRAASVSRGVGGYAGRFAAVERPWAGLAAGKILWDIGSTVATKGVEALPGELWKMGIETGVGGLPFALHYGGNAMADVLQSAFENNYYGRNPLFQALARSFRSFTTSVPKNLLYAGLTSDSPFNFGQNLGTMATFHALVHGVNDLYNSALGSTGDALVVTDKSDPKRTNTIVKSPTYNVMPGWDAISHNELSMLRPDQQGLFTRVQQYSRPYARYYLMSQADLTNAAAALNATHFPGTPGFAIPGDMDPFGQGKATVFVDPYRFDDSFTHEIGHPYFWVADDPTRASIVDAAKKINDPNAFTQNYFKNSPWPGTTYDELPTTADVVADPRNAHPSGATKDVMDSELGADTIGSLFRGRTIEDIAKNATPNTKQKLAFAMAHILNNLGMPSTTEEARTFLGVQPAITVAAMHFDWLHKLMNRQVPNIQRSYGTLPGVPGVTAGVPGMPPRATTVPLRPVATVPTTGIRQAGGTAGGGQLQWTGAGGGAQAGGAGTTGGGGTTPPPGGGGGAPTTPPPAPTGTTTVPSTAGGPTTPIQFTTPITAPPGKTKAPEAPGEIKPTGRVTPEAPPEVAPTGRVTPEAPPEMEPTGRTTPEADPFVRIPPGVQWAWEEGHGVPSTKNPDLMRWQPRNPANPNGPGQWTIRQSEVDRQLGAAPKPTVDVNNPPAYRQTDEYHDALREELNKGTNKGDAQRIVDEKFGGGAAYMPPGAALGRGPEAGPELWRLATGIRGGAAAGAAPLTLPAEQTPATTPTTTETGAVTPREEEGVVQPGTQAEAAAQPPVKRALPIERTPTQLRVQQDALRAQNMPRSVTATEFGFVDRAAVAAHPEQYPSQNRGFGDFGSVDLSGENTKGVAIPAADLQAHFGKNNFYQDAQGAWHASPQLAAAIRNHEIMVEVTNPANGRKSMAPIVDVGPGPKTGAGLDVLHGTAQDVGFTSGKANLQYRIAGTTPALSSQGDAQPPVNLADAAVKNTGHLNTTQDPGTNHGELACADAVTKIVRNQMGIDLPRTLSTADLYKNLRDGESRGEWRQVDLKTPGAIIVSPTIGDVHGHTGIVGPDGRIYSNSSATGEWGPNYTVESWTKRFGSNAYAFVPTDKVGHVAPGDYAPAEGGGERGGGQRNLPFGGGQETTETGAQAGGAGAGRPVAPAGVLPAEDVQRAEAAFTPVQSPYFTAPERPADTYYGGRTISAAPEAPGGQPSMPGYGAAYMPGGGGYGYGAGGYGYGGGYAHLGGGIGGYGGGAAYMPSQQPVSGPGFAGQPRAGGIQIETPENSTIGMPHAANAQIEPYLEQGTPASLAQAVKVHAANLSEDDPRVRKQEDNLFKGEYFQQGDNLHAHVLNNLPPYERNVLAQAQNAITNRQPMHITYASAPPVGAAPPTTRTRQMAYEESSPQARLETAAPAQLAGHSFIPTSVGVRLAKKADLPHAGYIQGISANAAANNHSILNQALGQMGTKSPYPRLNNKFYNDFEGYLYNLNAGYKGTGEGPAVGTEKHPNLADPNHKPYYITRREADFLNAIVNNQAAKAQDKKGRGKAIRELAQKAGTLITPEGETNPYRHMVDVHQAGIRQKLAEEQPESPDIQSAAKQLWSQDTLERTIRTFEAGLVHEIHGSPEEMPAGIRPGPEFKEITQSMHRQEGRPDIPLAAAFLPALSKDEYNELTGNIRKQWISGKIRTPEYLARMREVPAEGEPIRQEQPETEPEGPSKGRPAIAKPDPVAQKLGLLGLPDNTVTRAIANRALRADQGKEALLVSAVKDRRTGQVVTDEGGHLLAMRKLLGRTPEELEGPKPEHVDYGYLTNTGRFATSPMDLARQTEAEEGPAPSKPYAAYMPGPGKPAGASKAALRFLDKNDLEPTPENIRLAEQMIGEGERTGTFGPVTEPPPTTVTPHIRSEEFHREQAEHLSPEDLEEKLRGRREDLGLGPTGNIAAYMPSTAGGGAVEKPSNWKEASEAERQKYLESKVAQTLANQWMGKDAHRLEVQRNAQGGIKYDPSGKPIYVKHDYDIVNSPLLKKKGLEQIKNADEHEDTLNSKSEYNPEGIDQHTHLNQVERRRLSAMRKASAVDTMADRIVQSFRSIENQPDIMAGKGWYSRMRQRLAEIFPDEDERELFAQLLGATSAKTPVRNNFINALDALEQHRNGAFKRHIDKYLEGYNKMQEGDGALSAYMKKLGIQPLDEEGNKKADWKTDAEALGQWIAHHDILPKSKINTKYGANSAAVLKALAGTWLKEVQAPKTPNFAGNLSGRTLEATIDVWAARHLQRLGYEGLTKGKAWRAQAASEPGVTGLDFAFSQDAMRKAAGKIGMNPDDLQAILWFAEKGHYEKQGWTRGQGAAKSSFDELMDLAFPKSGQTMTSKELRDHYQAMAEAKAARNARIKTARGQLAREDWPRLGKYVMEHELTPEEVYGAPPEEEEEEEEAA